MIKRICVLIMFLLIVFSFGCKKDVPEQTVTPEVGDENAASPEVSTPAVVEPQAQASGEGSDQTAPSETNEPAVESTDPDELFAEIIITKGISIDPFELTVKAGTEVTWVNKHLEGVKDREFQIVGDKQDTFKSEVLRVGETFSHVYTTPGEYAYVIALGANAVGGKVIVVE